MTDQVIPCPTCLSRQTRTRRCKRRSFSPTPTSCSKSTCSHSIRPRRLRGRSRPWCRFGAIRHWKTAELFAAGADRAGGQQSTNLITIRGSRDRVYGRHAECTRRRALSPVHSGSCVSKQRRLRGHDRYLVDLAQLNPSPNSPLLDRSGYVVVQGENRSDVKTRLRAAGFRGGRPSITDPGEPSSQGSFMFGTSDWQRLHPAG